MRYIERWEINRKAKEGSGMKITLKWLQEKNACIEAIQKFCNQKELG